MTALPWTDTRVENLKTLWLEGLSASQVAARLGGVTRNAVIGKLHRLGLAGRGAPSSPMPLSAPRPQSPRRVRAVTVARPALRPTPTLVEPPAAAVDLSPLVRDLAQLGPHACRWPIGDPANPSFGFCGRVSQVGSYCLVHARRASRPAPPFDRGLMRLAAGLQA